MIGFLAIICAASLSVVSGHGNMVKPITWFDKKIWHWTPDGYVEDYIGMKSGMQCKIGCELPYTKVCKDPKNPCNGFPGKPGCTCFWFKNYTFVEKPTLFDQKLRTYAKSEHQTHFLHHPWRAPGSAPVDSPCGVSGGNYKGCVGGSCAFGKGGFSGGVKAETVEYGYEFAVTNWTRGDIVEAAWAILANHGGGYSYRLCKIPAEGIKGLTEECFQQIPLQFVGDVQWVQEGDDESKRIEIPTVRVNKGTFPEGSQWTRNPIPACIGDLGGFYETVPTCPHGVQFPPPKPNLFGFGVSHYGGEDPFPFSIVDKLYVPKDLEPGDYVLSFRWDTEQTPQVWNTCSSIKLH